MDEIDKTYIEELYFQQFPKELNADLIRLIAAETKKSKAECDRKLPSEEAWDVYPVMRRANVESKARGLVNQYYSSSIKGEVISKRKNGRGNYHTELRCGNAVLTIHKTSTEKTKVRSAVYRDSLARASQADLFVKPEPLPVNPILWAVMKYGVDNKRPEALAFVVVDFPDENGEIVYSIHLLKMAHFSNIPAEYYNVTATEVIKDDLDLGLHVDEQRQDRESNG